MDEIIKEMSNEQAEQQTVSRTKTVSARVTDETRELMDDVLIKLGYPVAEKTGHVALSDTALQEVFDSVGKIIELDRHNNYKGVVESLTLAMNKVTDHVISLLDDLELVEEDAKEKYFILDQNNKELEKEIKELKTKASDAEKAKKETEEVLSGTKKALENANQSLEDKMVIINQLGESLAAEKSKAEGYDDLLEQKQSLAQKIVEDGVLIANKTAEINTIKSQKEAESKIYEAQITALKDVAAEMKADNAELKAEVKSLRNKIDDISEKRLSEISELNAKLRQAEAAAAEAQRQVSTAVVERDTLTIQLAERDAKIKDMEDKKSNNKGK